MLLSSVADPDLQIRWGGGEGSEGHPDPEKRGGGGLKKEFFRPFGPQFGLKIRGVPSPPGPSPGSGTVHCRYPEDEGKSPHVRESKTTLDSGFHTVSALPGT